MATQKLSNLRMLQQFKLATSDNICIYKGYDHITRRFSYECANSGVIIETKNDYEVFV